MVEVVMVMVALVALVVVLVWVVLVTALVAVSVNILRNHIRGGSRIWQKLIM